MNLICKKNELNPGIAEIRAVELEHNTLSVIVIIENDKVYAYENKCPHSWGPLDNASAEINSGCKQYIQCSSHFAQFRKDNGYCTYGPCIGHSLLKLYIHIQDESIYYVGNHS